MHPGIEKLEQRFTNYKNHKLSDYDFFSNLWMVVLTIPKNEIRAFVEKVYDWAKLNAVSQPKIFALATYSMGFIAFHEEDYEISLAKIGEAQKLFSELNDDDGIAICNMSFSGCYRTLGNLELALKYGLEAFHQLNKSNAYPLNTMICSYGLSSLYLDTKNYERAIESYYKTVELAEKEGNKGFVVLAWDGLGDAYHQQKKDELAAEYLFKAYHLSDEINHQNFKSRVMSDIGTFYLDKQDYEKALDFHQRALAIREEAKIIGGSITNMIQIATIYRLQNKGDDAVSMLNKALSVAEKINLKLKLAQIHLMLSEIFRERNDLETGFNHYKIYHEISEEINKEDGKKKLKRSEMIFEAEQTKKENIIIKAQKAEIEKKNIELQNTIDELTRTKISRKAKAITLSIAVVLLIAEESLMHFIVAEYAHDNFLISLACKGVIVLCLKPIEKGIEHFLLKRVKI